MAILSTKQGNDVMACGKMTMECYCLTYGKEINFQIANLTHDHMCRQHATWAGKVVPLGYSTTVGLVMLAFFCGKNCKVIGYTVVSGRNERTITSQFLNMRAERIGMGHLVLWTHVAVSNCLSDCATTTKSSWKRLLQMMTPPSSQNEMEQR